MSEWKPHMTLAMQLVLGSLLADPQTPRYGLEIGREVRLSSGSISPILARLKTHGWVTSTWEDIDPVTEKRPRRHLYRLTEVGLEATKPYGHELLVRIYRQMAAVSVGLQEETALAP
ncbi:PadR family transcriptional regulator [Actinocorallia herbida]|uniref:PadR family transcriptional regulator n=1 Tax=Actinocorallia herbida TaxID=58109 RepID=A0A3N1CMM2_9ACTN|nr:helix-turn-helix transcriptional regulator [Actinocorallia herbida]ROO82567.1 PadR family transcriptional regulator [Actinocorallia herbida]